MRWLFLVSLLCIGLNAFAIDAEVLSITKDHSRNIYWVDVQYTVDGNQVINSYPVRAYDVIQRTQAEINQYILTNVQGQCKNYIANQFFKNNTDLPAKLNNIIGQSTTVTEAVINVDLDGNGTIDKSYEIKEDGTYVEVTP